MNKVFQFKQFAVDQTNCGMKVNTDAAVLGAIAHNENIDNILEIGTGTGVIALMLAQRFPEASITAVEIDERTSQTAEFNFKNSPFSKQISLARSSFEEYFQNFQNKKYDLIISNPPYFINSLKSEDPSKGIARHTNAHFFENLIFLSSTHLTTDGLVYLILPLDTAERVKNILPHHGDLNLIKTILIHSFPESKPYRCILVLGLMETKSQMQKFVIYEAQNVYTSEYQLILKDFLTIF